MKRAVFGEMTPLLDAKEDWSLYNIVQTVKTKVYNQPRDKIIEEETEVKDSKEDKSEKKDTKGQPKKDKAEDRENEAVEDQEPVKEVASQDEKGLQTVPETQNETLDSSQQGGQPEKTSPHIDKKIEDEEEVKKNEESPVKETSHHKASPEKEKEDSSLTKRKPEANKE